MQDCPVIFSPALRCILFLVAAQATSNYEDRLQEWGLELYHRERDPNPEGKTIDEILVASEEVVGERDPFPNFVNIFHVKTKEAVIRREVLFAVGEPFSELIALETQRRLRSFQIFSLVRVVPFRTTDPAKVGVLVVTKDLLSIRLNTQFSTVGTLIQTLRVRPSEINFLGRNKQVSLDFWLKLDTLSVGQAYADPRLLGSRLTLYESAAVIFNRHTKQAEGSRGQLALGLPLYSLRAEHGFQLSGTWQIQRVRVFRGAKVEELPYPSSAAQTDTVQYEYNARELDASAIYTRSFGRRFKTNVSAGVGSYSHRYTPPHDLGLSDDQQSWLVANYLPHTESANYLTGIVEAYQADYLILRDIESFGVSEDYQMGYSTVASIRWADPAFFSPIRYFELNAAARYRLYQFENLASLSAASSIRLVPGPVDPTSPGRWVNRRFAMELIEITPPVGIGRFALRGLLELNSADLEHRLLLLGGGNGLRGVEPEVLSGPNLILINLEYRTRPLVFHTFHIGLVLFYDAGSAYGPNSMPPYDSPNLTHTIGIGIRAMFPQLNKLPIRIDVGYTLNGQRPSFIGSTSASYGQVFDYRPGMLNQFAD